MHVNNQNNNNNNNSTSAIDLTYIYTLSIVKIKSIGNQTNSPKIRKDSCNHLRKLVLINTFIERKMAVYGEILKSKRSQQQQQQQHQQHQHQQHQHQQHQHQQQQLVHQLPPLTPPPSPPMNKHFVISPSHNVQHKQHQQHQQHQQKQHQQQQQQQQQQQLQQQQQQPSQRVKKSGYSYGGGFKRVQQQQKQQQQQRQKSFQVVQPIQVYSNQVPLVPQRTGFNLVQQPQIHWIPIQVPAHHHNNHNHQMHYNYSMVQTQEQQLYLQQHVFLPPHPRGPHAPPLHLAKLVRRPQLVRM